MEKKGLSISIIFKASSLNYGEGIGNISELKKLTRGNGDTYTYASRQAIRYDIVRLANKLYNWNLDVVEKESGSTVQFRKDISIKESEEMDLFGYMRTIKKGKDSESGGSETRSAAVRLSNAISLEEYKNDLEFLSNKGLADRIGQFPNLANIEQHMSLYTYTITIDLEKIGIDKNIEISNDEKAKRIIELLETIKILNRDIRGREEYLSPLFIIGGVYNINSPFFLGRVKLNENNIYSINAELLEDTMKLKLGDNKIENDTKIGIVRGEFKNENEVEEKFGDKVMGIQEFFDDIESKIKEIYQ